MGRLATVRAQTQLVVRSRMDITPKGGARITLDEVGLYTLAGGLIIAEQFFYAG